MANAYLGHGDLGKFKSQDLITKTKSQPGPMNLKTLITKTMEPSFIKTDSLFEFDFNS